MIIVDTALKAREAEGRPIRVGDRRRRLHGPGPDEPDRQQRPGDARGRRSRTGSPNVRSRPSATPGVEPVAVDSQDAARGRRRGPAARP